VEQRVPSTLDEALVIIAAQQRTIDALMAQVAALTARVQDLEARLSQNSSNSGRPPSSDTPAERDERPRKTPSGRKPGGQPGHKGHRRELLPPEQVTRSTDVHPERCERCARRLKRGDDPAPVVHQVVDVPPIVPDVSQYRLFHATCTCGHVTCAKLPPDVPRGMCGARLMALVALLTGVYHVGRRDARRFLSDVLGIRLSLGTVSQCEAQVSAAVAPAVDEVREFALAQPINHVDATGWRQGRAARTLWTVASTLATVFVITVDGSRAAVQDLLSRIRGFVVSDRAKQYTFWHMAQRQICWAHLVRKFVSFAERKGPAAALGEHLLFWTQGMFHDWHRVRDGTLTRAQFVKRMTVVQFAIEKWLADGVALGLVGVSGACKDILDHRAALWTFVHEPGVEPTNNHAERELRAFVLWRKRSFGSHSERGCRFAERVMTVVHTLRKQKRHVLPFLVAACDARLGRSSMPSLLPAVA
jgi:transposase